MNQKGFVNILLIVLVVAVIGIGGYFIMYKIYLGNLIQPMALSPYVDFEATIVAVSLDKSGNYLEGGEIVSAPSDYAVVRIDKIVETDGSDNFDWASLGIEEGKEASLNFKYTVRPAKIITVVGETTQSGDTVSRTNAPTKITFENNYFVFREDGNSESETILPGLQVGSKFKTKLWSTFEVKVGQYQIIP